jgi:cytochrome o ubiquinol oxidase operon protein cyoD
MNRGRNFGLARYVGGYIFSVLLTLEAYLLTTSHRLTAGQLVATILSLAIAQFVVQLYFFLHLGDEPRPRWRLAAFGFMVLVVLILVLGSLWIMHNLNYHNFTPEQMNQYINSQDGL